MAASIAHIASLRNWTALGIALLVTAGCGPGEESLGCAELVVSWPSSAEQRWWLAKDPYSAMYMEPQGFECGSWLAFIRNGASAQYNDVDLGTLRLRSTEDGGSLASIMARAPPGDATKFRPVSLVVRSASEPSAEPALLR